MTTDTATARELERALTDLDTEARTILGEMGTAQRELDRASARAGTHAHTLRAREHRAGLDALSPLYRTMWIAASEARGALSACSMGVDGGRLDRARRIVQDTRATVQQLHDAAAELRALRNAPLD